MDVFEIKKNTREKCTDHSAMQMGVVRALLIAIIIVSKRSHKKQLNCTNELADMLSFCRCKFKASSRRA